MAAATMGVVGYMRKRGLRARGEGEGEKKGEEGGESRDNVAQH